MWGTLGKIAMAILSKNNSPAFNRISGIAGNINSARNFYKDWSKGD